MALGELHERVTAEEARVGWELDDPEPEADL